MNSKEEYSEWDEMSVSVGSNEYNDDLGSSLDSIESECSIELPQEGDLKTDCILELINYAVDLFQKQYNLDRCEKATSYLFLSQEHSQEQSKYDASYFRYISYYIAYDRLFINQLCSDAEVINEGMHLINDAPVEGDFDALKIYLLKFFDVSEKPGPAEVSREMLFQTPPPEASPLAKGSMFYSPSSVVNIEKEEIMQTEDQNIQHKI